MPATGERDHDAAIQTIPVIKGFLACSRAFDERINRAARTLMRRNIKDSALRAAQDILALTYTCFIAARE
jgi:hypothetical protein